MLRYNLECTNDFTWVAEKNTLLQALVSALACSGLQECIFLWVSFSFNFFFSEELKQDYTLSFLHLFQVQHQCCLNASVCLAKYCREYLFSLFHSQTFLGNSNRCRKYLRLCLPLLQTLCKKQSLNSCGVGSWKQCN